MNGIGNRGAKIQRLKRQVETREFRHVYFIHAEGTGYTKIGHANDAFQRLAQLQTASPARLTLLGGYVVDNAEEMERELHQRYAQYRKIGEWFRLPRSVTKDIFTPEMMRSGLYMLSTKATRFVPGSVAIVPFAKEKPEALALRVCKLLEFLGHDVEYDAAA